MGERDRTLGGQACQVMVRRQVQGGTPLLGGGGDFSGGVGSLSVGTGHEEGRGCDDEGTGDCHGGGGGVEGIKHDLRCGATVIQ